MEGACFWTLLRRVLSHHAMRYARASLARTTTETSEHACSPLSLGSGLPQHREERVVLLLKLLRHALSELQKDYKLAAACLALLSYGDLNDVGVFRRFLAVVSDEFVCCYRPCEQVEDEPLDHDCSEWRSFFSGVMTDVATRCIVFITQEHALCIVGLVRFYFVREFGSLARSPMETSIVGKRKHMLKRAVALRAEEDDADDTRGDIAGNIPVQFVESLAVVLGGRGSMDRNRILFAHSKRAAHDQLLPYWTALVDSYQNCIRALVSIAELSIHLLPVNDRFTNIASALVWSLYRCLVRTSHFEHLFDDTYMGVTKEALRRQRLCSPLRFAHRIENSTNAKRALRIKAEGLMEANLNDVVRFKKQFDFLFDCPPPNEVISIVRGLFLKNIVDLCYLGMGYGDFLVWCRCDVSALDPILFW
jgi:hypothetical protein